MLRAAVAAVLLLGACGGASTDPPAATGGTPPAPSAASSIPPGKGIVASPKCSDATASVRVDVDDSGSPGTLMVKVNNTGDTPLRVTGASRRARADDQALQQGEHISFQMRATDNYYVIAARTSDATGPCESEMHALETDTRAKLGLR
jgi:hypothetical protein